MTIYNTLDDALTDIANRSFYEDATVTPINDGTAFEVTDDYDSRDEYVMWTYEGGMELPKNILDHSRLHEAYERYELASHVRYNLETAIETLEAGEPVTFQYVVADAYCDHGEDCGEDHAAGWALLAYKG